MKIIVSWKELSNIYNQGCSPLQKTQPIRTFKPIKKTWEINKKRYTRNKRSFCSLWITALRYNWEEKERQIQQKINALPTAVERI